MAAAFTISDVLYLMEKHLYEIKENKIMMY